MAVVDMKNKKFGRLTIIKRVENDKHGNAMWLCQCDCGKQKIISGNPIRQGKVVSCGCYNTETLNKIRTKHKQSHSRLYCEWQYIKRRCYNKNYKYFSYYGGKGIKVCDEWRNDFSKFAEWALDNGYSDELTLDRISSDGNYEPSNCRWVTRKVQQNNRKVCRYFTINGETHTLSEWCEIYHVPNERIRNRVMNQGWDLLTAIAVPPLTRSGLPIIDF